MTFVVYLNLAGGRVWGTSHTPSTLPQGTILFVSGIFPEKLKLSKIKLVFKKRQLIGPRKLLSNINPAYLF